MLLFLAMAGAIWGIGAWMRQPSQARWLLIALVWTVFLMLQIALPEGNPLREAVGGEPVIWAFFGLLGVAIVYYRRWLNTLRGRVPEAEVMASEAVDDRLERHARHIVLREIGGPGQKRLWDASVLVVGAGGLGSPALLYLAGAGVGTIGVIDPDDVDVSNLQRQVIHREADVGRPKVASAIRAMKALAPSVEVRPYRRAFDASIGRDLVAEYDLVLDGTDDWAVREAVNAACVAAGVPLISGAIAQWEGQLSLFDPARGLPCAHCVFPSAPAPGLAPSCAEGGVAGPLPGVIGSMMALEAVKHLSGAGETLAGRLMLFDGLSAEMRVIGVKRDPGCAVCGSTRSVAAGDPRAEAAELVPNG